MRQCMLTGRRLFTTTNTGNTNTGILSNSHKPLLSSWRHLPTIAASLSKARLSSLVVSTMLCGHLLNQSTTTTMMTSGGLIVGTALSAAAAASVNQWLEAPFDGQMRRTQCRVLPALRINPPTAVYVAVGWAGLGVAVLAGTAGMVSASLSALTILLYGAVYTPMKRWSGWNTGVGACVGAIPPMIGWFASPACTSLTMQSMILPMILFAWQHPHFHSLSFRRRDEYARAGYWMWAVVNPGRAKRSAVLWSLSMVPLCALSTCCGLTTPLFMLSSMPVNGWLVWRAGKFYRHGDDPSARSLFMASLLHLPVLMALLLLHRRGDNCELIG